MSETTGVPPPAQWAQRNDVVFLTVNLECKEPKIEFTDESLKFSGIGLPENKQYDVLIKFFGKIKSDAVIQKNTARCVEFIIPKAETGSWSNLTNDKKKHHWLKVDFNKWDDSDGSDDEYGNKDLASMDELVNSVGYLNNAGDAKPSFDDLDDDKEGLDSDDDDMPNLEV